jgi:hypothetical protein
MIEPPRSTTISDDAVYHVNAWQPPVVGRDAIRAELDRQFDLVSDYRSTTLNIFSKDAVVFIEGIGTFKHSVSSGKDVTGHWTSVQEIKSSGGKSPHSAITATAKNSKINSGNGPGSQRSADPRLDVHTRVWVSIDAGFGRGSAPCALLSGSHRHGAIMLPLAGN